MGYVSFGEGVPALYFLGLAVSWRSLDWQVRVQKMTAGMVILKDILQNDHCLESSRDIGLKKVLHVCFFSNLHTWKLICPPKNELFQ